jgi:predicted HTH transcriptional regulator
MSGDARPMQPDDLRKRIAEGESETLELKSSLPTPDAVARTIASFANANGGLLIIGVRESGDVAGADEARVRAVIERAKKLLSVSLPLSLDFVKLDGRLVAVVSVGRAQGIVGAGNRYVRRVGEMDRPLTADEIRVRMAQQSADSAVMELSRIVAQQTAALDRLREDFGRANSVWRKLGIGAIGAVLGAVLKVVIEHILPW